MQLVSFGQNLSLLYRITHELCLGWKAHHFLSSFPALNQFFFCINLRTLLKCHFTLTFSTGVHCIPQSVILEVTFALIFKMGKLTIFRKCLSSWQCKLILKNQKTLVYAERVTDSDSQAWTGPVCLSCGSLIGNHWWDALHRTQSTYTTRDLSIKSLESPLCFICLAYWKNNNLVALEQWVWLEILQSASVQTAL